MGVRTATGNYIQEEPSQVEKVADDSNKMPRGIPYIVGNEAAERFSYYGMKAILVVFMTQYLMGPNGKLAAMSQADAKAWYHMFTTANYFFPILGALVADIFWGKYKTIIVLSVVYCLGHLALALDETRMGLSIGLTLIAVGSGGIKPAVSAHVGDQFSAKNKHLIEKVFSVFYFSINLGAFLSSLATPLLLDKYGPSVAFGIPGLLMLIATIVFKLGDRVFVAIPPVGWKTYKEELFSPKGKKAIINLSIMYAFVAMFWSLFDQTGSSWVLQAEHMDRIVDLRFGPFQYGWLTFELLPAQLQAINPILVLALIPVFSMWGYPALNKIFPLNPLRKIALGMFVAAISFAVISIAEERIQAGQTVSMMWQFWAYVILTSAEIMVSITCLEFSYTQAPNSMKSFIMGLYLLCISLGNFFAAMVNFLIQKDDGTFILEGAEYFWFFTATMAITAVLFSLVASRYKIENYIQDHEGDVNRQEVESLDEELAKP